MISKIEDKIREMWEIYIEIQIKDEEEREKRKFVEILTKKSMEILKDNKISENLKDKIDSLDFFVSFFEWNDKEINEIIKKIKRKVMENDIVNDFKEIEKDINFLYDIVVDIILELKRKSNEVILAAWFKSDESSPIIEEASKIIKEYYCKQSTLKENEESFREELKGCYTIINNNKGKLKIFKDSLEKCINIGIKKIEKVKNNIENDNLGNYRKSKITLFKIGANFRFFYLCLNHKKSNIKINLSKIEKMILEEAYLTPCELGKLYVKEKVIIKKLQKLQSENLSLREIKKKRYNGVCNILKEAYKYYFKKYLENHLKEYLENHLEELDNNYMTCKGVFISLLHCASKRIGKYKKRDIREALGVSEEIVKKAMEEN